MVPFRHTLPWHSHILKFPEKIPWIIICFLQLLHWLHISSLVFEYSLNYVRIIIDLGKSARHELWPHSVTKYQTLLHTVVNHWIYFMIYYFYIISFIISIFKYCFIIIQPHSVTLQSLVGHHKWLSTSIKPIQSQNWHWINYSWLNRFPFRVYRTSMLFELKSLHWI